MKDFTATIVGGSERSIMWQEVMGSNEVVLKSPFAFKASIPGYGVTRVYEMDIDALQPEQLERLIVALARKFGVPEQEVRHDLDGIGCPVLADDIIVTIHNPQRWFN